MNKPTTKIKVLQCGCQKSGNFGLHRIVMEILKQNSLFSCFSQKSGISTIIRNMVPQNTTFDWGTIDNIAIENNKVKLSFPSPECRFLDIDEELLISNSTLIWTHSLPDLMIKMPVFNPVTHWIYIMRDGRDVVNSMIHYSTVKEVRRLFPFYKYSEPFQIYQDEKLFIRYVKGWKEHIDSYFKTNNMFLCIKLEDIISNQYEIIKIISDFLNLKVDTDAIYQKLSFKKLSKEFPNHLREGRRSDWKKYFTDKHKSIFMEIAGEELLKAGYKE